MDIPSKKICTNGQEKWNIFTVHVFDLVRRHFILELIVFYVLLYCRPYNLTATVASGQGRPPEQSELGGALRRQTSPLAPFSAQHRRSQQLM
jgi:hypothetical protein